MACRTYAAVPLTSFVVEATHGARRACRNIAFTEQTRSTIDACKARRRRRISSVDTRRGNRQICDGTVGSNTIQAGAHAIGRCELADGTDSAGIQTWSRAK